MGILGTLRPAQVDVTLGDFDYTIPALPADRWLEAIADPEGGSIVPGLLNDADQREIWRQIKRGILDVEELNLVWRDVLAAVTGMTWWAAAKLLTAVVDPETWSVVYGRLAKTGMDITRCSIGTFTAAVYALALDGCKDEQDRAKFRFDLDIPPPEVTPEEVFEEVDAGADFMAAMSQFRALGGRANAG